MVENVLQHSYLLSQRESYHGSPSCKSVSFLCTIEVEYIVAIETNKQMLSIKRAFLELSLNPLTYVFELELIHEINWKITRKSHNFGILA